MDRQRIANHRVGESHLKSNTFCARRYLVPEHGIHTCGGENCWARPRWITSVARQSILPVKFKATMPFSLASFLSSASWTPLLCSFSPIAKNPSFLASAILRVHWRRDQTNAMPATLQRVSQRRHRIQVSSHVWDRRERDAWGAGTLRVP